MALFSASLRNSATSARNKWVRAKRAAMAAAMNGKGGGARLCPYRQTLPPFFLDGFYETTLANTIEVAGTLAVRRIL